MKPLGNEYKEAEASTGEFEKLPAGGYVCVINAVEDKVTKNGTPYLSVIFDVMEGDYRGHFSDDWGTQNPWAHEYAAYYSSKSLGVFKGFLKAVDESNSTGFEAQAETGLDEQKLTGMLVGFVLGYEEYEGNDGTVKQRMKVRSAKSVKAIREGRFKVPELKKLETEDVAPAPATVNDDDLPF